LWWALALRANVQRSAEAAQGLGLCEKKQLLEAIEEEEIMVHLTGMEHFG
jgi:hypothetical protein